MQMQIDYPDSLPDLLQTTRPQFEAEARMAMAVKLYEMKRLSSGLAARLAGMNRVEFILNLHEADDENNLNFDKQADKKLKTLSDVNKTYRYGAFGFQAHDRSDPFKVEGVEIENIK